MTGHVSDSLRDALEKLLATTDGWTVANETLLGLLAAHPVEPAPVASRERVTEPTAKEYLAATGQYLDVPVLSAFMAGVVAEMLTPEQRARVIAYMREEEARVGVRS